MTLQLLEQQPRQTSIFEFFQSQQPATETSLTRYGNRLRTMDYVVLRSIVGRARHELKEFDYGGYSRSDKLKRNRRMRYEYLSTISISDKARIRCDKCHAPIEFNSMFFIQKRKSFNKYYHHSCALSLNMCSS